METIMDLFGKFGAGALVPLAGFLLVGILAQWSLYDKCGIPGVDCIIPVKNVISFLKIVGRPAIHSLMVMIPPVLIALSLLFIDNSTIQFTIAGLLFIPWIYFMMKVYIELCQSFGHYKMSNYITCILLNGFYVLQLGLSYSEKYRGPVYTKNHSDVKNEVQLKSQLA